MASLPTQMTPEGQLGLTQHRGVLIWWWGDPMCSGTALLSMVMGQSLARPARSMEDITQQCAPSVTQAGVPA